VTFCSDFVRREAEALYPAIAAKSRTIMNPLPIPPLPTSDERRAARARLHLPQDVPLIGNAGWLIPRKRFDVFLRVAAEASRTCRDIEFVVAGDGVERSALLQLAADLGLAKRVHWLGWQSDLTDFYRAIDVLQFNSDWDAMGLTCLEAASHAVPVIASVLNGGLGEVLDDSSGRVLKEHSIDALGRTCVEIATSRRSATELGLAGRAQVARHCTPSVVAGQYDELLSLTGI
jgi:glycosyltransferase involved in cell wall biosynthesis